MSGLAAGAAVALGGVLSGMLWRMPAVGALDAALFRRINRAPAPAWLDARLRLLRPLGSGWAVWPACAALALLSPAPALLLAACTLALAGVERGLKLVVARRRPFQDLDDVDVRVRPPADPGFPSGDAARVWLLATALGQWSGAHVLFAAAAALALVVALGRVRAGVHYPLDVWAGACLGAGTALVWSGLAGAL